MKSVLDTNAYCLCALGHETAIRLLAESQSLWLPSIAYGELYYGFRNGNRHRENLVRLNRFIEEFHVEIVEVDSSVAEMFGEIFASLRKKGKPIPTNDIWIAACTMAVGGTLLTGDKHFKHIDQIRMILLENET
jgi:tRNA(fMet)-specific endonuclease VapC